MVTEGKKAPNIKLSDADGELVELSKLKGSIVVVYFYPKDDTSGCTKEALDFTSQISDFEAAGATVLGISPDNEKSHKKFTDKHDLKLRLLADVDKKAAEAYEVWVEKSMYGRKYMGVERSTFLIDKTGKLARAWRKVKVPGHVSEVLAAVKELGT
jgi:peroxiredoxin Q/BCP